MNELKKQQQQQTEKRKHPHNVSGFRVQVRLSSAMRQYGNSLTFFAPNCVSVLQMTKSLLQ